MSCGWGSGGRNRHGPAGAYLSRCNDGDMAPGRGYERLEMALAGRGERLGGGVRYSPRGPGLRAPRVCAHDGRRSRSTT